MMRALLSAFAFLIALPVLAQPAPMSSSLQPPPRFLGKDLAGLCEGPENSARLAGCLRYLQGAVAMYELSVAETKDLSLFCAPREAPASVLRQQYVEWVKENADQLNQEAILTVKLALADAFPCAGD
jgi:hypothetical protein